MDGGFSGGVWVFFDGVVVWVSGVGGDVWFRRRWGDFGGDVGGVCGGDGFVV